MVPAVIGDLVLCLRLADRLNSHGINVQPILYPAVAESAARLRFFISCDHADEQLESTADILAKEIDRLRQEARGGQACGGPMTSTREEVEIGYDVANYFRLWLDERMHYPALFLMSGISRWSRHKATRAAFSPISRKSRPTHWFSTSAAAGAPILSISHARGW